MKPPAEFKVMPVRECPSMQTNNPLSTIESPTPDRTLKIEETGDAWKGVIKPKIRLMGRWLDKAGFKPGSRVQVVCVGPGVIQLRSL
jgi:hypothetical protein